MVFILCVLGGGSELCSFGGEEFTRLEPILLIVLSRPMGSLNFPGGVYVFATSSFFIEALLFPLVGGFLIWVYNNSRTLLNQLS